MKFCHLGHYVFLWNIVSIYKSGIKNKKGTNKENVDAGIRVSCTQAHKDTHRHTMWQDSCWKTHKYVPDEGDIRDRCEVEYKYFLLIYL